MRKLAVIVAAVMLCLTPPTEASEFLVGEPVGSDMPLGSRAGNPIFELPEHMRLLSPFGERPVFSPDGSRIAFIGESYGDAFEYNLTSGTIRNLTSHAAHKGFLRVHYLADGNFLLLGPRVPAATREATRNSTIELFWMDAAASRPPVALGRTVWEGIAVSRSANLVAWAESHPLVPAFVEVESTSIHVGEIVMQGGQPALQHARQIVEIEPDTCLAEPQDFLPGNQALTMPCYFIPNRAGELQTRVMQVDIHTGQLTTYPTPEHLFGEVEGLFPDGNRTLVECSADRSAGMDLCLLELSIDQPGYRRLTRIMDFGRWKFGNPVVSPDARYIAVQIGSADVVDAGVGQGIVLIEL